jgi:hypothetical protein
VNVLLFGATGMVGQGVLRECLLAPDVRSVYAVSGPVFPLLKRFPKCVTTTEQLGRAMLEVLRRGAPKPILEGADINSL